MWCGIPNCIICLQEKQDVVLSSDPKSASNLFTESHYLLLDTNVILDQIDVFEEDVIKDVLILQTVLDEVKHRSATVYKRLREIIQNSERRFNTFVNEHHWYVKKK